MALTPKCLVRISVAPHFEGYAISFTFNPLGLPGGQLVQLIPTNFGIYDNTPGELQRQTTATVISNNARTEGAPASGRQDMAHSDGRLPISSLLPPARHARTTRITAGPLSPTRLSSFKRRLNSFRNNETLRWGVLVSTCSRPSRCTAAVCATRSIAKTDHTCDFTPGATSQLAGGRTPRNVLPNCHDLRARQASAHVRRAPPTKWIRVLNQSKKTARVQSN
jgi:hypothetical protein